jgi:hypothetical protein
VPAETAEQLRRAGHWRLSRVNILQLVGLTVAVVMAALFLWFATSVWPLVPAVVLGLIVVAGTGAQLYRWLARRVKLRYRPGTEGNHHYTVSPTTRKAWREQRWAARRDIKLIIGTFVITAVGAFIGGIAASPYIVDLLRR